jgi:hypothetical protein
MPVLDLVELQEIADQLDLNTVKGDGMQKQLSPDLPVKKRIVTERRISFVRKVVDIEKVSRHLFSEIREPDDVGATCFDRTLQEAKKK